MIPEYFHIGLPKTGTTTIQEVMESDNRINLIMKSGYLTTISPHITLYPNYDSDKINIESDEGIIIHNLYFTLKRISELNPDAKIIVTIREQRALLISGYKQVIRSGKFSGTFIDFLNSKFGINFIEFSDYSTLYDILTIFIKKENVHFLVFEKLKDDYSNFFKELYGILGLGVPSDLEITKANVSFKDSQLNLERKLNRMMILKRDSRFGEFEFRAHRSIKRFIRKHFNQSNVKQIQWKTEGINILLEKHFSKSNQEFIEKTGFELKKYNYL